MTSERKESTRNEMDGLERWLNEWVDRHDAGPDFIEDETLAVFAFIAELRMWMAANHADIASYRQAALELHAAIRDALAWIGSGNPDFIAHNDLLRTADKWRELLEDSDE